MKKTISKISQLEYFTPKSSTFSNLQLGTPQNSQASPISKILKSIDKISHSLFVEAEQEEISQ